MGRRHCGSPGSSSLAPSQKARRRKLASSMTNIQNHRKSLRRETRLYPMPVKGRNCERLVDKCSSPTTQRPPGPVSSSNLSQPTAKLGSQSLAPSRRSPPMRLTGLGSNQKPQSIKKDRVLTLNLSRSARQIWWKLSCRVTSSSRRRRCSAAGSVLLASERSERRDTEQAKSVRHFVCQKYCSQGEGPVIITPIERS